MAQSQRAILRMNLHRFLPTAECSPLKEMRSLIHSECSNSRQLRNIRTRKSWLRRTREPKLGLNRVYADGARLRRGRECRVEHMTTPKTNAGTPAFTAQGQVDSVAGALLELKLIGDIGGRFLVARYQRGYRWGRLEVLDAVAHAE